MKKTTTYLPVTWIVGASSGIGLELTKIWLQKGHKIIASSRNATHSQPLQNLLKDYPTHLVLLDLDVISAEDASNSVEKAWKIFGHIDRWFYNAGAYEAMRLEQWSQKAFEEMNQINYMGAVRLMIPLARFFQIRGHGEWIWNISLSAYIGLPYGGGYSAPKAALLNLAESIRPELLAHGITLRIINHGFVKTRLTLKNDFTMPQLMEPYEAASIIAHEVEKSRSFEIRFPRLLSSFLSLLRALPYSLSLLLTSKALR